MKKMAAGHLPLVFSSLELLVVLQRRRSRSSAVHLDLRRSLDLVLGRRQKLLEHRLYTPPYIQTLHTVVGATAAEELDGPRT